MYAVASSLYVRRFIAPTVPVAERGARRFALAGACLHAVLLAFLWHRLSRPPVGDLSEALLVYAWLLAVAFVLIGRTFPSPALGAFMLPLATLLYAAGLFQPESGPPQGTDFANPWFQMHVAAFFVAYAAFSVSFCTGLMYLMLARDIRRKRLSRLFARLPSLEALDLVSSRAIWLGLPLAALGLVSGVIWGGTQHHQWWHWEPKIVAAAITALLYAGYLAGRQIGGWRGRRAAVLSIVGFALSVFTLVGGSLLAPHGQGF